MSQQVEARAASGLRAVRLTAASFLLLDAVDTLLRHHLHDLVQIGDFHPLDLIQGTAGVVATLAVMWRNTRLAAVAGTVLMAMVLVFGGVGVEPWFLLTSAVMLGALARPRTILLAGLAWTGYAIAVDIRFAAHTAHHPGTLTAWQLVAILVGACGVGMLARGLLRARDRARSRVAALAAENAAIRAAERRTLAAELQGVISQRLDTTGRRLAEGRGSADPVRLRQALLDVDAGTRAALGELRTLVEVLREEDQPPPHHPSGVLGADRSAVPGADRSARPGADRSAATAVVAHRWVDALTARHVRLAAISTLGLLVVKTVLDHVPQFIVGDLSAVLVVAVLAAATLAVWRPAVGVVAAVGCVLTATVLGHGPGYWDIAAVALAGLLAAIRCSRACRVLAAAAIVGLALVTSGVSPGRGYVIGYVSLVAVLVGLTARHFLDSRRAALAGIQRLRTERARIRTDERSTLARELHDVVAHHLSLISLQFMGREDCDDVGELQAVLAAADRANQAATTELALLVHAMHSPAGQPGPVVTACAAGAALADRLAANGFTADFDIDAAADTLDPTTQRTVARILQETTTNILRYAPPGATCTARVAVDRDQVTLAIDSPLADRPGTSDLSLGMGLRGLRERVDLTGGTFLAGPHAGQWQVRVSLPRNPTRVAANPTPGIDTAGMAPLRG